MKFSHSLLLIACCILQFSCTDNSTPVERAFYYWKSNEYQFDKEELAQIQELRPQKLYVKFFEIEKDEVFHNKPASKSILHIRDTHDSLEIIPTVYIRNEVLGSASQTIIDTLAVNIIYFIDKLYRQNMPTRKIDYNEIQIDCDWTGTTRDTYFQLLESLRKKTTKTISCTLRLYPYKYRQKMGIPPVEKATLMCYNLLPPLAQEDENSIQNNRELELYLKRTPKYPIHLDIALPVYAWLYIYQNNQFKGVLNWDTTQLPLSSLKPLKPLWYEAQEDIQLGDFYLRKGDKVKLEESSAEETLKSISLLKKYLRLDHPFTVALFHLDSKNRQQYSYETLHSFYDQFTQ